MPIRPAAILDALIKTERHTTTIHHPRDTPDILRFLLFLYTLFLLECLQIGFEWAYGEWTYNVFPLIFLIGGGSILGLVLFVVGLTWFLRVIGAVPESSASHLSGMVNVFRDALTRPDNALLPPFTKQPEISPTELALGQRTRVGQLQALTLIPMARTLWGNVIVGARIGFQTLIVAVSIFGIGIIHGMTLTATQHMARIDSLFPVVLILAPIFVILIPLSLFAQFSWKPPLQVDSTGLWWWRFPEWRHIPWGQISAFVVDESDIHSNWGEYQSFLIVAPQGIISWFSSATSHPKARAASARLVRLVVAHTGQPLRDMTLLLNTLAASYQPSPLHSKAHAPKRLEPALVAQVSRDVMAHTIPRNMNRQRFLKVAIFAQIALLLIIPYIGSRYVHDVAQPGYFASLPARLHARHPLFADSLTAPDGLWPVQMSTTTHNQESAYANGGYTLSSVGTSQNTPLAAVRPASYGAVALEVTVTAHGTDQADTYDGYGIVVRNRQDDIPCAFVITTQGAWWYTCSYGKSAGHNPAIHTGLGAMNTLLVIAHANNYVFYVNGQLVGSYYNSEVYGGTVAQVGLINFDSGIQAAFTNFAIWSVPAPPSFEYV